MPHRFGRKRIWNRKDIFVSNEFAQEYAIECVSRLGAIVYNADQQGVNCIAIRVGLQMSKVDGPLLGSSTQAPASAGSYRPQIVPESGVCRTSTGKECKVLLHCPCETETENADAGAGVDVAEKGQPGSSGQRRTNCRPDARGWSPRWDQ